MEDLLDRIDRALSRPDDPERGSLGDVGEYDSNELADLLDEASKEIARRRLQMGEV